MFTDNSPVNETLEFLMFVKALHNIGVDCYYEIHKTQRLIHGTTVDQFFKLGYNLPFLKKAQRFQMRTKVDLIIVQEIRGDLPKLEYALLSKTWFVFRKMPPNFNNNYKLATYFMNTDDRFYKTKNYNQYFRDKIMLSVGFGFDKEILSNKKGHRKKNLILFDDISINDPKANDMVRSFENIGWKVDITRKHRLNTFTAITKYEEAKVLFIGNRIDPKYMVLYAMAKGVLIIKIGKTKFMHLNDVNCVICDNIEEGYNHLIKFYNNPQNYQHYVDSGHQYFSITQDIYKNTKQILESLCSQTYMSS